MTDCRARTGAAPRGALPFSTRSPVERSLRRLRRIVHPRAVGGDARAPSPGHPHALDACVPLHRRRGAGTADRCAGDEPGTLAHPQRHHRPRQRHRRGCCTARAALPPGSSGACSWWILWCSPSSPGCWASTATSCSPTWCSPSADTRWGCRWPRGCSWRRRASSTPSAAGRGWDSRQGRRSGSSSSSSVPGRHGLPGHQRAHRLHAAAAARAAGAGPRAGGRLCRAAAGPAPGRPGLPVRLREPDVADGRRDGAADPGARPLARGAVRLHGVHGRGGAGRRPADRRGDLRGRGRSR